MQTEVQTIRKILDKLLQNDVSSDPDRRKQVIDQAVADIIREMRVPRATIRCDFD